MTKVINLYGGPGTGKSTIAAGVFYSLKMRHTSCELVREFAKDLVWEGRTEMLNRQLYIFAKQHKRLQDLDGKVDVVITDAPLLMAIVYGAAQPDSYHDLVHAYTSHFDNIHIDLNRVKPYSTAGRTQTEAEALALDADIGQVLWDYGENWETMDADYDAVRRIVSIYDESVTAQPVLPL